MSIKMQLQERVEEIIKDIISKFSDEESLLSESRKNVIYYPIKTSLLSKPDFDVFVKRQIECKLNLHFFNFGYSTHVDFYSDVTTKYGASIHIEVIDPKKQIDYQKVEKQRNKDYGENLDKKISTYTSYVYKIIQDNKDYFSHDNLLKKLAVALQDGDEYIIVDIPCRDEQNDRKLFAEYVQNKLRDYLVDKLMLKYGLKIEIEFVLVVRQGNMMRVKVYVPR